MPSLNRVLQAAVGGAFEIGRELQGAGMSRVFLAREPALARDVVVKVLPPDLVSTSSLQRFRREVEVTARLQHPHILPVITAGGNDDLLFYVAPFIRGESLRARLAAGTPLSLAESIKFADELLNAVGFAHARGVIHRDIKPGNILLSEGHAILADFGIAAVVEAEHPAEHSDHVTGSTMDSARIYVAPEQPRDEQRDLFAAAVVIHEMAVGSPAPAGVTAPAIATALKARHPRAAAGDVRRLSAILARGLSVDPKRRYASANDFRASIHSIGRPSRRPLLAGIGIGSLAAMFALSMFALRPPATPHATVVQAAVAATPLSASDTAPSVAPVAPPVEKGAPVAAPIVASAPMPAADSAAFLVRRGDLSGAGDMYRAAIASDPANARAQLGVAFTIGLQGSPAEQEESRTAAQRALAGTGLDAHDRAIAEGFVALADRRYPDACAAFARARDTRATLEAWMGLGECTLRDDAVIVTNGVPAFRSGYATSFNAFVNAARVSAPNTPSIVYRRLMQTVPQTGADIRVGRTADNRMYVGQWRVADDTLGFTLRPGGVPAPVAPEVFAASAAAAKIGRDMVRPAVLSMVAQSPHDAGAHEVLALLLENMGLIAEEGDDRVSALTAIARARKLERDGPGALRLATTHARLLLRARQYEALADLTDSLLAAKPSETAVEAEALMPLAILTGRIDRATELLSRLSGTSNRLVRGADGRPVELPGTVVRERADFLVRASLGVCDARVKSAPKRLVEVLDASFPNGVLRGVEASFVGRIVLFALPCVGPAVTTVLKEPSRSLVTWARAFDPRDTAFAAEYAAMERVRPPMPAGAEAGVDGVIVDAMVKLALKDSASALRQLTLALDRVPMLNRGLLLSEWAVGSTARGMALAAETASKTGDRETAQRWSSAITTLWRNADPELQPQVERLRAIVRATADDPHRE